MFVTGAVPSSVASLGASFAVSCCVSHGFDVTRAIQLVVKSVLNRFLFVFFCCKYL